MYFFGFRVFGDCDNTLTKLRGEVRVPRHGKGEQSLEGSDKKGHLHTVVPSLVVGCWYSSGFVGPVSGSSSGARRELVGRSSGLVGFVRVCSGLVGS